MFKIICIALYFTAVLDVGRAGCSEDICTLCEKTKSLPGIDKPISSKREAVTGLIKILNKRYNRSTLLGFDKEIPLKRGAVTVFVKPNEIDENIAREDESSIPWIKWAPTDRLSSNDGRHKYTNGQHNIGYSKPIGVGRPVPNNEITNFVEYFFKSDSD